MYLRQWVVASRELKDSHVYILHMREYAILCFTSYYPRWAYVNIRLKIE